MREKSLLLLFSIRFFFILLISFYLFCAAKFFSKKFEFVPIALFTIPLMCTPIDTPIDSYFFYRIFLFSFVCTYFYLLESLLIYDNLFLFRIICKNLFLFMMICKNLFHLFSSVRNSFYLLSFVRISFIKHISDRSSEMPFLKE